MTADKWIQVALGVVVAALSAALWFGKRERDDGVDKATVKSALDQIPQTIALAIAPFVAEVKGLVSDVQGIKQRISADDTLKLSVAREDGKRDAQFTQVKEQVDELDEQVEDLGDRVSTVEGRVSSVEGRFFARGTK